jgi:hypothetical protein
MYLLYVQLIDIFLASSSPGGRNLDESTEGRMAQTAQLCHLRPCGKPVCIRTEIPTIIDPSATRKYASATGSIIVGISVTCNVCAWIQHVCVCMQMHMYVFSLALSGHVLMCVCVCVCVIYVRDFDTRI